MKSICTSNKTNCFRELETVRAKFIVFMQKNLEKESWIECYTKKKKKKKWSDHL